MIILTPEKDTTINLENLTEERINEVIKNYLDDEETWVNDTHFYFFDVDEYLFGIRNMNPVMKYKCLEDKLYEIVEYLKIINQMLCVFTTDPWTIEVCRVLIKERHIDDGKNLFISFFECGERGLCFYNNSKIDGGGDLENNSDYDVYDMTHYLERLF